MTSSSDTNDLDLGDDFEITKMVRQPYGGTGTWVRGRLHGHRFDALVFPAHAENPDWELADSRISKLWVQRVRDKRAVFNWDRGMDIPALDETAEAIVDFLAGGLADYVFAK